MTDALSKKQDIQRVLDYVESVGKESRKALTVEFNQLHKGIPFSRASDVLRNSVQTWFGRRDRNLRLTYEKADSAMIGEVRILFLGEAKNARFKLNVDARFTVSGGMPDSPSYLKELNVTVDKRALTD